MNKSILVARREYLENVRTRGFWFGILLVPILYSALILGPAWISKAKSAKKYAVIDQSGWLLAEVEQRILQQDLTTVLLQLSEEQDLDASLPGYLAGSVRELAGEPPQRLAAIAADLAGTGQEAMVPSALDENREALIAWWRALSEAEVRRLFDGTSRNRFIRIEAPNDPEQLNQRVLDEQLFAYFVIGPDPIEGSNEARYISQNLTDDDLQDWFTAHVGSAVRDRRLAREEIDPSVAAWIQAPYRFEGRKLTAEGKEEEVATQDLVRQWAPAAFVYLLWLSVFSISNMLLTNTIEEKSNRLIEVLLSSMSPIQLMAGKMAGIALTGLTMVGTWILCVILASGLVPRMMGLELPFDVGQIISDPAFMVSFAVYFLLGYLLYGSLLAGIGSVFNSLKESQAVMGPIMMILFIPLILMVPISEDPNSILAKVLSYIPPLTPFVMMNRAAAPPTMMEYALTSVLLLASVVFALWASAKIFRIGILLTGKPPKLKEILRWLRAPVGQIPDRGDAEETI